MGLWGSDRGFDGVLMGFLGVPWVNGGSDRGLLGLWGFMGVWGGLGGGGGGVGSGEGSDMGGF